MPSCQFSINTTSDPHYNKFEPTKQQQQQQQQKRNFFAWLLIFVQMLRNSPVRHIVPQAHAMIPQHCKIRGHMYRPTRLNFYCRLASTTRHQRSWMENFMFNLSLNSDVGLTLLFVLGLSWGGLFWGYCLSSYSLNSHKNRQFCGALNSSERFQRNADMQRIFDNHSKRVAEVSKERGIPIRDNHTPSANYYLSAM